MIKTIAAMDLNGGIGFDNELPWGKLTEDMFHFSSLTRGKGNNAVVMGMKTFESIGQEPLPERINIVLSRKVAAGVYRSKNNKMYFVVNSIDVFLDGYDNSFIDDVWIIGGSEVYKQFLPYSKELYLTYVHEKFTTDSIFPNVDSDYWKNELLRVHEADALNPYTMSFYKFTRIKGEY